jgi:tetratricopeptide (TPR) repeat protein
MAEATSVSREERMNELLKENDGAIDPALAVNFLRDRKLPGGISAGNGNRDSLNALIATHATVMDLSSNIFWAASPPNQLGKFVAFDVNNFTNELPDKTVPADEMLSSGEYEKARESQKCLADGQRALKKKDADAALNFAEKAESLNPGFYQNATLRGRALLALNRNKDAAQAFETALAEHPAFLKEKQELESLLRQTKNTN